MRLEDNAALWKALKSETPVLPIFVFDKDILSNLEDSTDSRVTFLHRTIESLDQQLKQLGSGLKVFYSRPEEVMQELSLTYDVKQVFFNRDYEPYALERDLKVASFWKDQGVEVIGGKDHVIFEKNEVVKADGTPYLVYSPYAKAWRKLFTAEHSKPYPNQEYFGNFLKWSGEEPISLGDMGFQPTQIELPELEIRSDIISKYDETRNFPANKRSTTRIGLHLRFGTLSIRQVARDAQILNDTFLSELIWRDFFQMALYFFPESREKSIKPKYDAIPWVNNESHFEAWCNGKTGYPMVDAGMRELNSTGYMHNRVRMVVASFLTKHLLIDWRWGEAYFAEKLLDFDLASNIGGWQWASGSGLDAAPYFRVFNPTTQLEKFDKQRVYVNRWIPELDTSYYPDPIVDHKWARERCLSTYKQALAAY
jgi:deoxyribodipyrimidine photo-lyase|tara:strand:- start:2042 stop:3313 length:1272 start_codon:yes stop_codon:yes gene_type:complete